MVQRNPVEVSEEQVLYFRARRGHLAGGGAADAATAARALVGAQAQQLPPALWALSQRIAGRPTASALKDELFSPPRRLVRTWGQRDTLHVYDSGEDWAPVVAARELWSPGGRGGPLPSRTSQDKALRVLLKAAEPLGRASLLGVAGKSYEKSIADRAGLANMDVSRLAAGRLLWCLANRGDACVADKVGAEQMYATREAWFPDLHWQLEEPLVAASRLAARYLATYGPATAADVAHFFGAKVSEARRWLAELGDEIVEVRCDGRKELVLRRCDLDDLQVTPPKKTREWPLRLLPLWESMLMGHADKSWTVPDETERKIVWRKAAYVAAVVLARGRVVATWTHKASRRHVDVDIKPLSGWRQSKHAASARREAAALAAHLGLDDARVRFED